MNVFAYCRVSGKSQVEGDGFPRQESAIQIFCANMKLHLRGHFKEQGVSGTVEGLDRPAFAELISYIDARADAPPDERIYAVVVERMDRLARDLMVSEVLLSELRKRGVSVFSADQGALIDMASDGGDPTRVLIRQIMGALAQWEKTMLVKKLRAAKVRLKAAGLLREGTTPYGELPGEKVVLDFMVSMRDDMTYRQIANLLNGNGCLNRSGKSWTHQNVRTILINNKQKAKQ